MKVSVEDYTITEEGKNGLDVSIDVNLKQWRDYGTKTVTVETPQGQAESTPTVTVEKERDESTCSNGQDLHGKGRRLPLGHRGPNTMAAEPSTAKSTTQTRTR